MDHGTVSLINLYLQQSANVISLIQESVISSDQAFFQSSNSFCSLLIEVHRELLPAVRDRRTWNWARHSEFWELTWISWPEDMFIDRFRVSKASFVKLLSLIKSQLTREVTQLRTPLEPAKRLAIALRYYATGAPFAVLADNFGIGVSTLRETVWEVTDLFLSTLPAPCFPTTKSAILETALIFNRKHTFPDVVGCVDGTHIPIIPPLKDREDYWCYKQFYNIIFLGVCDWAMRFTYFDIGTQGKASDGGATNDVN